MRKNSSDSKEENSEPMETKEEDETIKKEEGNPQNLSEAVMNEKSKLYSIDK